MIRSTIFSSYNRFCTQVYVVSFLLIVFFVPFLVITASYAVVTARVFSFSRRNEDSVSGSSIGGSIKMRQLQKKGSVEEGACGCCCCSVLSVVGSKVSFVV